MSGARGEVAGAGFIDPAVLARIDDLALVARTVVDGFLSGLHRAPHLGLSLDFAEHRPYMPGDDLRRIDWRLWARTDRLHVKQYEADTNADLLLVVDASRSMAFGSRGWSKLDYAKRLAATLAHLSRRQRDRVGLVVFDEDVVERVPPSARHFERVLHALARARAERAGALAGPLQVVAASLRRRGIVALVSDLYEEPDLAVAAVRALRARGGDVVVFHLLDPAERELPYEGAARFRDLETGERLAASADGVRERYREMVRAHARELARRFAAERIDYVRVDTSEPLDAALFHYLSSRERAKRRGATVAGRTGERA